MAGPRQMTSQTLNALKGWPSQSAVDFSTTLDDSALVGRDRVERGTTVHLNAAGKFALGVGDDPVIPMFLFQANDEPDVSNYGGDPATEKGVWIGISNTGKMMAFVAAGAYELCTTCFVPGVYAPNTPLTSPTSGADAGRLTAGTLYTDMIVGLVSRGVINNGYGHDALAFWPQTVYPTP